MPAHLDAKQALEVQADVAERRSGLQRVRRQRREIVGISDRSATPRTLNLPTPTRWVCGLQTNTRARTWKVFLADAPLVVTLVRRN